MKEALITGMSFAAWATLHSLLAGAAWKRRFRAFAGEGIYRWYRLAYVGIALVTIAPIAIYVFRHTVTVLYSVEPPWRLLMRAVQAGGLVGAAVAVLQAYPRHFLGLEHHDARTYGPRYLKTYGVYGVTRHPMYFFSLVAMWFNPDMTLTMLVLFCLMTAYFWVGSVHEEMLLVNEYGTEYLNYRRRVPRILPFLRLPPVN